jgi:hypothetical protein
MHGIRGIEKEIAKSQGHGIATQRSSAAICQGLQIRRVLA